MSLTVRLNPTAERALDALAKRRRQTRSDVVREALEHYTSSTDTAAAGQQPYDTWADVIGIVHSGGRAKRTTGELFTDIVGRKARTRRAR